MCLKCDNLTRRDLLKILGAGAGLLLAGCQVQQPLPELPPETSEAEGGPRNGAAAPIDERKLIVPPPRPPVSTDYGIIMPRAAWTRTPPELPSGAPIAGITRVTLHHSGDGKPFMGESIENVARHLQWVREAHLKRGMIDIAYHFAVDRVGRAWQLRSLLYEGQHVRIGLNGTRNNAHNVGVVALGDFDLQLPTVVQRDRVMAMARLIRTKYALPSAAVVLHGELVQTDCPGKHLAPQLVEARKRGLM